MSDAPIRVHADINIYAPIIGKGKELGFEAGPDCQAYMVLIESEAKVGEVHLNMRDAIEIVEENVTMRAIGTTTRGSSRRQKLGQATNASLDSFSLS